MGKRVLLLGLGMQGKAVLHDLVNCDYLSQIFVVDVHPELPGCLSQYPGDSKNKLSAAQNPPVPGRIQMRLPSVRARSRGLSSTPQHS